MNWSNLRSRGAGSTSRSDRSMEGGDDSRRHAAAPVMTRLRQPQRLVLDTLVDAGVAKSRSDALADVRSKGGRAGRRSKGFRENIGKLEGDGLWLGPAERVRIW